MFPPREVTAPQTRPTLFPPRRIRLLGATLSFASAAAIAQQTPSPIPSTPLSHGFFTARLASDGVLTVQGIGWPSLTGTWKQEGDEITLVSTGPKECAEARRYRFRVEGIQGRRFRQAQGRRLSGSW